MYIGTGILVSSLVGYTIAKNESAQTINSIVKGINCTVLGVEGVIDGFNNGYNSRIRK